MKKMYAGLAGLFFMATLFAFADETENPAFENNRAMTSYALGVQTGRTFAKDEVDIDIEQFIKGLKDQAEKKQLLLSDEQLRKIMNGFQSELRRGAKRNRAMAAGENMRVGTAFLDENKKKPGVVALPDGLQYRVITEGHGKKPEDTDIIESKYRGTTVKGNQFDATQEGKTATMKVAQLIPGMREALKLMPAGSRWEIVIPSQLAYGQRAIGTEIGPNETLIFDWELVSVK